LKKNKGRKQLIKIYLKTLKKGGGVEEKQENEIKKKERKC
jgi:hypothetical protein